MNLEEENRLLKAKVSQLISDNLELASRLEHDYDPTKSVRKLTLQEKLELNMGNLVLKYRISSKDVKNIYGSIMMAEKEPEYIDLSFDNDRMYRAFYFVDLEKEAKDIEKGEDIEIELEKVPEYMPQIEHQLDIGQALSKLTDFKS